jgi:hypothetical protein
MFSIAVGTGVRLLDIDRKVLQDFSKKHGPMIRMEAGIR